MKKNKYFYERLNLMFYYAMTKPDKIEKEATYLRIKPCDVDRFVCFIKDMSYEKRFDYFISQGADISREEYFFYTAFIEIGNLSVIRKLISMGMHVNWNHNYLAKSLVSNNQLQTLRYLKSRYEIDLHFENDILLWLACKYGHIQIVQYLLEYGLDVHANDDAAIKISSLNKDYTLINLLIKYGANIHAENEFCAKCTIVNNDIKSLKLLLNNGGEINVDEGRLLCDAIEEKNAEILSYLLTNDCKPTSKAMQTAMVTGNKPAIEMMVESGYGLDTVKQDFKVVPIKKKAVKDYVDFLIRESKK